MTGSSVTDLLKAIHVFCGPAVFLLGRRGEGSATKKSAAKKSATGPAAGRYRGSR
jgi:hypothetical protein